MAPESPPMVETLRWRDGRLELLDQRLLPAACEYRRYEDAAGVADAIRTMVVRGAPAIGCAAAYGIALEAARLQQLPGPAFDAALEAGFRVLAASRPTAVNLSWALERVRTRWRAGRVGGAEQAAAALLSEAREIHAEDIRTNRAIGGHGAPLLADGARVLTHCNAGALATGGYGTALGVIRSAVRQGKKISVLAGETRPYLQGARLTAWEMMQEGIPVTLITDGMSGYLMSLGAVDAVIVGADRVAANGDVVNKIGTYMVAVLAHRHRIPFYVACPRSTIDLATSCGANVPIEERDVREVTGFRGVAWAPEGVQVRNPAFDVTPAPLVTALITERGVLRTPSTATIAGLFQ